MTIKVLILKYIVLIGNLLQAEIILLITTLPLILNCFSATSFVLVLFYIFISSCTYQLLIFWLSMVIISIWCDFFLSVFESWSYCVPKSTSRGRKPTTVYLIERLPWVLTKNEVIAEWPCQHPGLSQIHMTYPSGCRSVYFDPPMWDVGEGGGGARIVDQAFRSL